MGDLQRVASPPGRHIMSRRVHAARLLSALEDNQPLQLWRSSEPGTAHYHRLCTFATGGRAVGHPDGAGI
ncbi:Uncharacterized protein HZ326_29950 [Fusarium oxysporum f. sp. albedinis]|nr:Uncharacterized protein HZ326_29950 [Fusarium oxysporum f. sp. albedinis]